MNARPIPTAQTRPARQSVLMPLLAATMALSTFTATPATAASPFSPMADRLPPGTESIVAVNVDKVLASDYGKQQHWAENMAEGWAKRPQVVVPGVSRLLMGSDFVASKADTSWEVTLMEMATMPEVAEIAKAEGGSIDRVWDRDAVLSPLNAYFVPIDKTLLAVLSPASRKTVVTWVRQEVKPGGNITSPYIKTALDGLGDHTDIVMALDMTDAYPTPNIRRFLDDSDIEGLKGKNLEELTRTIASMTGLTLQIYITKEARGLLQIDFASPAVGLADVAKPLLAAVLNRSGMQVPDLSTWEFKAAGNAVSASGPLTDESLRRLLSVVQSPVPALVTAAQSSEKAAPPADPGVASQRYFKSVSLVLDSLSSGQPTSISDVRTWYVQAAKRIDNFPILNVDPAVVEWSSAVSMKLKQVAGIAVHGQTEINARVAGVMTQDTFYYDAGSSARIGAENTRRQRQQAGMEQKAQVQERGLQALGEINGMRQKVRADMVAKYKLEF